MVSANHTQDLEPSTPLARRLYTHIRDRNIDPMLKTCEALEHHATQQVLLIPHEGNPHNGPVSLVKIYKRPGIPLVTWWLYPQWTGWIFWGIQRRRFREYIESMRLFQPHLKRLTIVAYGRGAVLARWAMRNNVFNVEMNRVDPMRNIGVRLITPKSPPRPC